MTINVYWACLEEQWMLAKEPESVSSIFYQKYTPNKQEPLSQINYCPAFNGHLKNLFAVRSIYDYSFKVEGNNVISNMYNQEFYENHVVVRSLEKRFFSFQNKYIFFTDAPSLDITLYEYPFLEDNNVTQRCTMPAGQFNIGKWFRNTELAFFLKRDYNEFKVDKNEIMYYVRFHTNEKIKFQQFRFTNLLGSYNNDGFKLTINPIGVLENFYKVFRTKKLILKEIQNNLI